MNKKDLAIVVALILLIPVWNFIVATWFPAPEPPPVDPSATPVAALSPTTATNEVPDTVEPRLLTAPATITNEVPAVTTAPVERLPEERLTLSNELISLVFNSYGAGISHVRLHTFPATLEDKDRGEGNPIEMDFADSPALVYDSEGLDTEADFAVEEGADARSAIFTRTLAPGITFVREVRLEDNYVLRVTDRWENATDTSYPIPDHALWLGTMRPLPGVSQKFGPYLGVDARHTDGVDVKHYVKDIAKKTRKSTDGTYEDTIPLGLDWVSAKNKFFTQVLTVEPSDETRAEKLFIRATKGEGNVAIGSVQSGADIAGAKLPAGQVLSRDFSYFVGPMHMSELKDLGLAQDSIIDFRLFRIFNPIGRLMMNGLDFLHGVTRNWGIAIILLTVVVRLLFWPLTQKGTENMKKMSELSPQIKEIREKYKSNPQKMNQAMSNFYRENKVNPMAGCLPMLVQIPVFISLYGVLRVAVGLRFAEFLWVKDLSEPENLFGLGINILPLTMGATMILQQRMTPNTMDEQQRKIMMMMPLVFLFICYSMPAGLLLYWTTSNILSIYQTWHLRRKQAAANPDATPSATTGNKGGKR